MNTSGVPIKLIKKDDAQDIPSPVAVVKKTQPESHLPVEPHVQLVEVSPGVYDIIFTCKCGEKTTIRCNSLELPSASTPPPSPTQKKTSVSDEESAA